MDKTSLMMAAGDMCEFSNFHHIKLSLPNLQTGRNRPGASAEWAAVSKDQLDACSKKGFCCRSNTFHNAWVLQNEQIVPSVFPFPIPSHLILFIPPCRRGRGSAGVNSLSDEKDKWQRCFGSGDSAAAKTERVREGVWSTCRGWNDERLEVTDVSRLVITVMIRNLPVFQMHRPPHLSSHTSNHHQLYQKPALAKVVAVGCCSFQTHSIDSAAGKQQKETNEFRDLVAHSFSHVWKIKRSGPVHFSSFLFLLRQDNVVSDSN